MSSLRGVVLAFLQRLVPAIVLVVLSSNITIAQDVDFSANMRLLKTSDQSETVKLYCGRQRVRLDRTDAKNGSSSLIIDFYTQSLFILIPESKLYVRGATASGMPFYQAAWLFRPHSSEHPCGQWISEADRRGLTLRCQRVGEDRIDGRSTVKWEATSPEGANGVLWYDPTLNFVVKVLRTSKDGIQSGYELQDIKPGVQPKDLLDPLASYREFSMDKLLDALTGVSQW